VWSCFCAQELFGPKPPDLLGNQTRRSTAFMLGSVHGEPIFQEYLATRTHYSVCTMDKQEEGVALTPTKGQARDANIIKRPPTSSRTIGDKIFIDIGPGQPCPDRHSHRDFINDNVLAMGASHEWKRKGKVVYSSSTEILCERGREGTYRKLCYSSGLVIRIPTLPFKCTQVPFQSYVDCVLAVGSAVCSGSRQLSM
jgi:hypothetical protein